MELARGGGHHAIAEMLTCNGGEEPVAVGGGAAPVASLDDYVGQRCESFPNGQPGRIVEDAPVHARGSDLRDDRHRVGAEHVHAARETLQHQQQITADAASNGEAPRVTGTQVPHLRPGRRRRYEEIGLRAGAPSRATRTWTRAPTTNPSACVTIPSRYEHDWPDDEIWWQPYSGCPLLTGLLDRDACAIAALRLHLRPPASLARRPSACSEAARRDGAHLCGCATRRPRDQGPRAHGA